MIAGKVDVHMFPRPAGDLGFESDELANAKGPNIFPCFGDTFGFCLGDVVDIAGASSHMRRSLTICEEQGVSMALVLADILDHGSCGIWKGLWSPWISSVLFGEVCFPGIRATLSTYLSVCLPIFQPFPPKKRKICKAEAQDGPIWPSSPRQVPGHGRRLLAQNPWQVLGFPMHFNFNHSNLSCKFNSIQVSLLN